MGSGEIRNPPTYSHMDTPGEGLRAFRRLPENITKGITMTEKQIKAFEATNAALQYLKAQNDLLITITKHLLPAGAAEIIEKKQAEIWNEYEQNCREIEKKHENQDNQADIRGNRPSEEEQQDNRED